mgnify:CR=1 FL=1
MTQELSTCLWFDKKAKEAFQFYKDVFGDVELLSENPMAVVYKIYGRRFMNFNGGPEYSINPSISFFISAANQEEIEVFWNKLSNGGNIMMPLNKYPWSEQYGWCADQYGVNWQLMLGHESSCKIMPHMMFVGQNAGKTEEAINFYANIFDKNKIVKVFRIHFLLMLFVVKIQHDYIFQSLNNLCYLYLVFVSIHSKFLKITHSVYLLSAHLFLNQ